MSSHHVQYTDEDGCRLDIHVYEDASAWIGTRLSEEHETVAVDIPAEQREPLARALAGWHSGVVPIEEDAAQATIERLMRERDDLQERLARGKADALRAFADTMDRLPDDWILIRRDYGSEVTVEDLLRQTADRYVEQPYPILTQIRVDPKQPDRPEPVDPSDVRVGDVVEIEADDWMVRGKVNNTDVLPHGERYRLCVAANVLMDDRICPDLDDATVRVLHRAEPEPDEAAVEALAEKICEVRDHRNWGGDSDQTLALKLIRRGVEVPTNE